MGSGLVGFPQKYQKNFFGFYFIRIGVHPCITRLCPAPPAGLLWLFFFSLYSCFWGGGNNSIIPDTNSFDKHL